MKIRKGFVSNSSSSSYTCDVCNRTESGWDLGIREASMFTCLNNHTYCDYHMDEDPFENMAWEDKRDFLLKSSGDWYLDKRETELRDVDSEERWENEDWEYDWEDLQYDIYHMMPEKYCPICNLKNITGEDMLRFLIRNQDIDKDKLEESMRMQFHSYKEFLDYVGRKEE